MKKHAEDILLYHSPACWTQIKSIVGIMVNVHFVIIAEKKNEPIPDTNDL